MYPAKAENCLIFFKEKQIKNLLIFIFQQITDVIFCKLNIKPTNLYISCIWKISNLHISRLAEKVEEKLSVILLTASDSLKVVDSCQGFCKVPL